MKIVEGEHGNIQRILRNAAAKNHAILRHFYRFLPEESNKLCYTGVTLALAHNNSLVVDWRISAFRIADPSIVASIY